MGTANKRKGLRILMVSVLILVISVGGLSIWASMHYKNIIRERLPGIIAKATNSLYLVSLQDISVNLLIGKVHLSGIRLYADTSRFNILKKDYRLPKTVYDITVPGAEARGIGWLSLLSDKELNIGQFTLWQPEITIRTLPADSLDSTRKERKNPAVDQIRIQQVRVVQPRVNLRNARSDDPSSFIAGGTVLLNEWILETGADRDTSRFFYAKRCQINLDSFVFLQPGGLYQFRTGSIVFDSRDQHLKIKDLSLQPAVSKQAFYKRIGHQKEIYTLQFPGITVQGLNWRQLLEQQTISAAEVALENPDLDIYMNRIYSPNTESKMGKFPHQLLQQLPFPVDIRDLKISNGNFKYTEVNDKTKRPGDLPIRKVNGTVSNITNMPDAVLRDPVCLIRLRGLIMGSGDMQATFQLFLNSPTGAFTVTAKHGPMDGKVLNTTLHALALARVESMQLDGIDLFVEGDERLARGRFTIRYHDLKVQLEGVDDAGNMDKKDLLSFLANTLMVYTDNPMKGEPVRKVTTEVKRDPYKSFFNLIWKNIFNGTLRTAIRNENMVDNINRRQTKQEKERKEGKKEQKGLLKKVFGGS